jgi:hypothetical protein
MMPHPSCSDRPEHRRGSRSSSPESDNSSSTPRSRSETPVQKVDRSYLELLHEVRVALTGVQLVLAFLLVCAYSPMFRQLSPGWRVLYVVGLVSGLSAAACLIAPACWHRLIYGRRLKPQLFALANRLTLCGMGCLLGAVACVLALVVGPLTGGPAGAAVSAFVLAIFGMIWYILPLVLRRRPTDR